MVYREHRIQDHFVLWKSERLVVTGIQGVLQTPLERTRELYGDLLELAPVKKEPARKFLAAVYFNPFTDVTIVQTTDDDSSIVTYSLDKDARQLIAKLMDRSGFTPNKPTQDFIQTIDRELIIEQASYERCRVIARLGNAEFDRVFGAVSYTNFLIQYRGFSQEEGLRQAAQRFGLPPI